MRDHQVDGFDFSLAFVHVIGRISLCKEEEFHISSILYWKDLKRISGTHVDGLLL